MGFQWWSILFIFLDPYHHGKHNNEISLHIFLKLSQIETAVWRKPLLILEIYPWHFIIRSWGLWKAKNKNIFRNILPVAPATTRATFWACPVSPTTTGISEWGLRFHQNRLAADPDISEISSSSPNKKVWCDIFRYIGIAVI